MSRPCKELKRMARETLNRRYTVPMGAFVVANLVTAAIEIPFSLSIGDYPTFGQQIVLYIAEFIISLIGAVLACGGTLIQLNMTRNLPFKVMDVFSLFKRRPERFIGSTLLLAILEFVAALPLMVSYLYFSSVGFDANTILITVIAGVISLILTLFVVLNFSFIYLFLLDYPEMKVITSFKESFRLMHHNRARYLYTILSFIGWGLIAICSLGVALLWIKPYYTQTMIYFYMDCTGEADRLPAREYQNESTGYHNPVY